MGPNDSKANAQSNEHSTGQVVEEGSWGDEEEDYERQAQEMKE